MAAMFSVLRTGCRWHALHATGICSGRAAHRRFQGKSGPRRASALRRGPTGWWNTRPCKGLMGGVLTMDGAMTKAPLGGKKWASIRLTAERLAPHAACSPTATASPWPCRRGCQSERRQDGRGDALVGAILTPGKRTVTAALQFMALAHVTSFQPYHHDLNRAVWSSREGSRLLVHLLVHTLAPTGPLVMGSADTMERRRGAKILARRIDGDPVRSADRHVVKASGLRWFSLMRLVPLP